MPRALVTGRGRPRSRHPRRSGCRRVRAGQARACTAPGETSMRRRAGRWRRGRPGAPGPRRWREAAERRGRPLRYTQAPRSRPRPRRARAATPTPGARTGARRRRSRRPCRESDHDAEGLPMPPEQERLPVPRRRGRKQAPGDERGRGEDKDSSARPGDLGPSEGDCEVRPDEEGNRARDEEVELDSRRHDAAENVQLAELVEPKGAGEDPRRGVGKKKRHAQDDHDDSCAATRTEDERPLNRPPGRWDMAVWIRAKGRRHARHAGRRRLGAAGRRGGSNSSLRPRDARRPSPAASIQPPVLRKKLVDSLPARNPDVASSPGPLSSTELPLAQQRSDCLRARSERIRRLGHSEVVLHGVRAKILPQLSQNKLPLGNDGLVSHIGRQAA